MLRQAQIKNKDDTFGYDKQFAISRFMYVFL